MHSELFGFTERRRRGQLCHCFCSNGCEHGDCTIFQTWFWGKWIYGESDSISKPRKSLLFFSICSLLSYYYDSYLFSKAYVLTLVIYLGQWSYNRAYHHSSYCFDNCWIFSIWMWEARSCHLNRYEFLCWCSSWGNSHQPSSSSFFFLPFVIFLLFCFLEKQLFEPDKGKHLLVNPFTIYCRCQLLERKCLEGVVILGICIPILQQSMSVLDELKGERDPSHKFQFWLCQMMVLLFTPHILYSFTLISILC